MNNVEKLYWITRLDGLNGLLIFTIIASAFYILFYFIFCFVNEEEYVDFPGKVVKSINNKFKYIALPVFVLSLLGYVFTPTRDEMILIIAGGETLDYVENNKSIQEVTDKAPEYILKYLNNQIDELKNNEQR